MPRRVRHVDKRGRRRERCLYATCFNEDIFNRTGKECLSSFFEMGTEGDLFIGYEGGDALKNQILTYLQANPIANNDKHKLFLHNLDNNKILNKVLKKNKDIIPVDYGGTNEEMNRGNVSENRLISLGATKYFLYRASKWWRVFATLDAAAKQPNYDYVVQIDADIAFLKQISLSKIQREMTDNAIIYHEGDYRRDKVEEGLKGVGVETSFTVYSKKYGGYDIIYKLMAKLTTKDFRNHGRWDDSFLLSYIIHNEVDFKCRDLITDNSSDSHVVERGPFRDYILHFKGMNGGAHDGTRKYNHYMARKNETE